MDAGRIFQCQNFKFDWHTSTGLAFQDLFASVMENAWPSDFQRVDPLGGQTGDLKCDGYWESHRCVFQCYGPASMRDRIVIRKIKGDLEGAVTHWHGRMSRWTFVHNQIQGLTARVVQCLDDLKREHPGVEISVWGWPQMREQFRRLSDEARAELFGYPPSANLVHDLGFGDLVPIVGQIAKGEPSPADEFGKPPSVTKLQKNSLDPDSASFLQVGRLRVRLVEEYFEQHHDPALGDKIANAMRVQYQVLTNSGLGPNDVLFELQRFAGWDARAANRHNAAVLAVIMYFFDRCDIFEDPDEDTDESRGPDR